MFFWFGDYCSSFSSATRKGSELKQKDRLDLSPWLAFCLGFVRFFLQLAGLLGFNGLTCAMEEQRRAASHPGGYYGAIMIAARSTAMLHAGPRSSLWSQEACCQNSLGVNGGGLPSCRQVSIECFIE